MPIQIPKLERFQPQGEPSVGRMEIQPPNLLRGQQMESQAIQHLAGTGIDLYERVKEDQKKQELFTADTLADAAAVKYHRAMEERLLKAKEIQGDPTQEYMAVDDYGKKLFQEINDQHANASPLVKYTINKKLQAADNAIYDRKVTARAHQYSTWETGVKNDTLKLHQNNMAKSAFSADRSDPNSLNALESDIMNIEITSSNYASKVGRAQDDPTVLNEKAKYISEGLKDAIKNLSASGKPDAASYVYEKWKQRLLPDHDTAAIEAIKGDKLKLEIGQEVDKLITKPEGEAYDKAKTLRPEIRKGVMDDLNSYYRKIEHVQKMKDEENFNRIGAIITKAKVDGKPFLDVNSMWKDPTISQLAEHINPRDRKVIESMVTPSKVSDEDAKAELMSKLMKGDFQTMTYSDLQKGMAKLSEKDRTMFDNEFKRIRIDTEPEQRSRVAFMSKRLAHQLEKLNLIKPVDNFGRRTVKDEKFLNDVLSDMMLETKDIKRTIQDQEDWVIKRAAELLRLNPPDNSWWPSWSEKTKILKDPNVPTTTTTQPPVASTTTAQSPVAGTTTTTTQAPTNNEEVKKIISDVDLMKKYRAAHGGKAAGTVQELIDFKKGLSK